MFTPQCDALKKDGSRCLRRSGWTVPNTLSGTGYGKDDWVHGRSVHLCCQHGDPFWDHKTPVRLIAGGFLQPYNRFGYGSVVLDRAVDWNTCRPPTRMNVPKYWKQKEPA